LEVKTIKFEAVLFDLDGTLLDTLEDLANSFNDGLREYGFEIHPVEAYGRFIGDGAYFAMERALPAGHRDEATVNRCLRRMRHCYSKRWKEKTRPYAGVAEMLDELEARDIPKAVLSNKPDDFTKIIVDGLLGKWRFEAVEGVTEQREKKPDPTAALEIARGMNIRPERFLYVGDTDTDMQTAVAAGMYPAGALWGFRDAEELVENGAKVLLGKPTEIIDLINGKLGKDLSKL